MKSAARIARLAKTSILPGLSEDAGLPVDLRLFISVFMTILYADEDKSSSGRDSLTNLIDRYGVFIDRRR